MDVTMWEKHKNKRNWGSFFKTAYLKKKSIDIF